VEGRPVPDQDSVGARLVRLVDVVLLGTVAVDEGQRANVWPGVDINCGGVSSARLGRRSRRRRAPDGATRESAGPVGRASLVRDLSVEREPHRRGAPAWKPHVLLAILAAAASFGVAELSWRFVESPALRRKQRFARARSEVASVDVVHKKGEQLPTSPREPVVDAAPFATTFDQPGAVQ
jgi:hypothetical protein